MNKHKQEITPVAPYNTNPFSVVFNAFNDGLKRNQNLVIALIVGGIIIGIVQQIPNMFSNIMSSFGDSTGSESIGAGLAAILLIFGLGASIVNMIINAVWASFGGYAGLTNARARQATFSMATSAAWSKFWSVLGIQFITGLIVGAWLLPFIVAIVASAILAAASQDEFAVVGFILSAIFFIVGFFFAIRAQLRRSLSIFSLFDGASGSFDAMNKSIALTKNRLVEMMGMSFAAVIVPIIGPALASVGLGAYYVQLSQYRQANVALPKMHILSWLPLILIGAGIVLVLLIAALIGALVSLN